MKVIARKNNGGATDALEYPIVLEVRMTAAEAQLLSEGKRPFRFDPVCEDVMEEHVKTGHRTAQKVEHGRG